jgi:hypothetical protein
MRWNVDIRSCSRRAPTKKANHRWIYSKDSPRTLELAFSFAGQDQQRSVSMALVWGIQHVEGEKECGRNFSNFGRMNWGFWNVHKIIEIHPGSPVTPCIWSGPSFICFWVDWLPPRCRGSPARLGIGPNPTERRSLSGAGGQTLSPWCCIGSLVDVCREWSSWLRPHRKSSWSLLVGGIISMLIEFARDDYASGNVDYYLSLSLPFPVVVPFLTIWSP